MTGEPDGHVWIDIHETTSGAWLYRICRDCYAVEPPEALLRAAVPDVTEAEARELTARRPDDWLPLDPSSRRFDDMTRTQRCPRCRGALAEQPVRRADGSSMTGFTCTNPACRARWSAQGA